MSKILHKLKDSALTRPSGGQERSDPGVDPVDFVREALLPLFEFSHKDEDYDNWDAATHLAKYFHPHYKYRVNLAEFDLRNLDKIGRAHRRLFRRGKFRLTATIVGLPGRLHSELKEHSGMLQQEGVDHAAAHADNGNFVVGFQATQLFEFAQGVVDEERRSHAIGVVRIIDGRLDSADIASDSVAPFELTEDIKEPSCTIV